MGLFKKIWTKIDNFVVKTYTDRKTGELFLSVICGLGATGVFFWLAAFILQCIQGLPLWCIILDIALIIFCIWAVVKGIIPMAKEAFELLENSDKDENKRV